ncbi:hypothetical protein PITC_089370 [Penicillium italicum]|uniref:Uncharacterized protein n=1 Tax=Penicillium italicum TaxID=40296 RepID=A0A0A2LA43_PENIT|nr:hypothetical protein PITC_089370 [Penicillium italicum]
MGGNPNFLRLLKSTKKNTATETQAGEMQASEKLPNYEEIAKFSEKSLMDKLNEKIEEAQKPEDLLVCLISTKLSIKDKATLLKRAPKRVYDYSCHQKNAEKVEAQLKDAGYGEPMNAKEDIQTGISLPRCVMIAQDEAAAADGAAAAVENRGQWMGLKLPSTPKVIVLQPAVAARKPMALTIWMTGSKKKYQTCKSFVLSINSPL